MSSGIIRKGGKSPLAAEVERVRKAAGLTQAQLAEKAKVGQPDVSKLERGKPGVRPTAGPLFRVAAALGLPPGHFAPFVAPGVEFPPPAFAIPEAGFVPAGAPIEAAECPEVLDFRAAIGSPEAYALTVRGDSMIGAGIVDGDRIIVRPADTADSGDLVVARVGGEDATLKRLVIRGREWWLMAANERVEPRAFDRRKDRIVGVVVAVFRSLR